jgi:flagellar FliL protein
MGRKKKEAAEGVEGEAPEAKKGKSNLVPAIVIAVGLIGGGKMMGGGAGAAAPAAADGTTTTTEVVLGPVVKLDPITLNVADGHYLRVGLGLQLSADAEGGGGGGGHGAPAEPDTSDKAGHYAKALDIVIGSLGRRTYTELVATDGRTAAKDELVHLLTEAYHEEIVDLYFTEFVLQ